MNKNIALFQKVAYYYGMSIDEFAKLINGDAEKLARFIEDYLYNHN